MTDVAQSAIDERRAWPGPERYADRTRPPILMLQYSLVTGGAGCAVQRLADGLSDAFTVDVVGLTGEGGAAADAMRSARAIPAEAVGLARHARRAGYRYIDAAFPLGERHANAVELTMLAAPAARLGIRLHSEACYIARCLTDRTRAIAAAADVLYFHHDGQRREVCRVLGLPVSDRTRIAPPGVDVLRFAPGRADPRAVAEVARRYDLFGSDGRRRLVVAMAGRAASEKNWLDYLAICGHLKDHFGDRLACLAITGPQRGLRFRRHLEEIAAANSALGAPAAVTGLLDDVESLYAHVDVYVQCSCSESFGRSAAEAAAAGIPVVATAVGGLAACVVVGGVTGCLIAPSGGHAWNRRLERCDRARFVDAILGLLGDEGLRRRMGAAGMAHARSRLDDRVNTAWHRRVIGDLIGGAA